MLKVLIIGSAPLPEENTKSRPAAGLRTYQFLKPILGEGEGAEAGAGEDAGGGANAGAGKYKVELISIAMPECYASGGGEDGDGRGGGGGRGGGEELKEKRVKHSDHYSQVIISKSSPRLHSRIQKLHDHFAPDVIISVNTYPSWIAAKLVSNAPLWTDLNGWVMAEAQAQAYKMNSNDYLSHYYGMEALIVKRADKLSAVSKAESQALWGELAAMGRLNKESFGYDFVAHIPNGTEWFSGEQDVTETVERAEIFKEVPSGSCVLLWLGGYNTWVDERGLFEAVEGAMKRTKDLYFVSTGGAIAGLDNKTFNKFKEMIDASDYSERFIFLGWVQTEDIPFIYSKADFGLNVDRMCMETLTGARNRINEMMKFGLPVVTTLGSEIAGEVERVGAGLAVKSGDTAALEKALMEMYKKWQEADLKEFGERGAAYIKEQCNYEKTLQPVLKWLKNPKRAPDEHVGLNLGQGLTVRGAFRYFKENGTKKFLGKVWQLLSK